MRLLKAAAAVAIMGLAGIVVYGHDQASGIWLMVMAGALWARA